MWAILTHGPALSAMSTLLTHGPTLSANNVRQQNNVKMTTEYNVGDNVHIAVTQPNIVGQQCRLTKLCQNDD